MSRPIFQNGCRKKKWRSSYSEPPMHSPLTPIKTTVIPIWPSTNVRSTQGDRWLFAVSDEYLKEFDQRKLEENGKMGGNLKRKRQLEKYNAYKEEVAYWVDKTGFEIPHGYFDIWFYI